MQPPQQHSWINLAEIKAQLVKKLGLERSKQYFDYLNRFLSLKLSKSEFDKLCLRTIGKDNIRLHNQLIRSVLKNACTTKLSSGVHDDPSRTIGNRKAQNGPAAPVVPQVTSPLALTNGDILPPSPRKPRTLIRDRKAGERKSTLGSNGKTNYASFSSSIPHSNKFNAVFDNGVSSSHMQQAENSDFIGVNHKKQTESLHRKDEKGVLHAPLGVPFCPVSIGGAHGALPLGNNSKCVGELHINGLLDTKTLKEHMEQIAASHGLQGVSMDCANVMNNGLDVYLKSLIRSCTELQGSRSVPKSTKNGSVNNPVQPVPKRVVSLLDFRVAMELNRTQIGEDWPILFEKICTHGFEE